MVVVVAIIINKFTCGHVKIIALARTHVGLSMRGRSLSAIYYKQMHVRAHVSWLKPGTAHTCLRYAYHHLFVVRLHVCVAADRVSCWPKEAGKKRQARLSFMQSLPAKNPASMRD